MASNPPHINTENRRGVCGCVEIFGFGAVKGKDFKNGLRTFLRLFAHKTVNPRFDQLQENPKSFLTSAVQSKMANAILPGRKAKMKSKTLRPTMTNQERLVLFCLQAHPGQTLETLTHFIESRSPNYLRRTVEILLLRDKIRMDDSDTNERYFAKYPAPKPIQMPPAAMKGLPVE